MMQSWLKHMFERFENYYLNENNAVEVKTHVIKLINFQLNRGSRGRAVKAID
jgi:hypothetical protein